MVIPDGVVEFEEVEFRHGRKLCDRGVEAEVAFVAVVGLHVAAKYFSEQEIGFDGPSWRKVIAVNDAAREVRLCEKFGRIQVAHVESGAHTSTDFGVLSAQRLHL